jgi:hypothetical protein
MIKKSNRERILALFFVDPTKHYQLREISRLTDIGLPSVKRYVETFVGQGLIKQEKGGIYPYYIANRDNEFYKTLKLNHVLLSIRECGLVSKLEENYPDCIVLFGSASRGEDTKKSDIDIFVQSEEKKVVLKDFERKMKRNINVIYESNMKKVPKELTNSLANGIVLYGFLKVV